MEKDQKPAPLPAPVSITIEQAKLVAGAGLAVGALIKIAGGIPAGPLYKS